MGTIKLPLTLFTVICSSNSQPKFTISVDIIKGNCCHFKLIYKTELNCGVTLHQLLFYSLQVSAVNCSANLNLIEFYFLVLE